jgi:hypothetical protein
VQGGSCTYSKVRNKHRATFFNFWTFPGATSLLKEATFSVYSIFKSFFLYRGLSLFKGLTVADYRPSTVILKEVLPSPLKHL